MTTEISIITTSYNLRICQLLKFGMYMHRGIGITIFDDMGNLTVPDNYDDWYKTLYIHIHGVDPKCGFLNIPVY